MVKLKSNFECIIQDGNGKPCGEVRASKQGISAHIVHSSNEKHGKGRKGFKVEDSSWKKTSKKAKPSLYNPEWGKGTLPRGRKKKDVKVGLKKALSKNKIPMVTGTLRVPVELHINFALEAPTITQENLDIQTIVLGKKK